VRGAAKILVGTAVVLSWVALCAAPAGAQEPAPWDGSNPFNCELQDVGTGTEFPHPQADPFCVEFDKTSQNVTDLGIVDFLLNEPARTAAAAPKCFYFQSDHWTGSVVQGQDPELWHWDGTYFFDKATGSGGVSLHNLRILGQPADASQFVPDDFKPYLYEGGGGGGKLVTGLPADPTCAARVDTAQEKAQIYFHCLDQGGAIQGRTLAGATLREHRDDVTTDTGPAQEEKGGFDRWCAEAGGEIRIGYPRKQLPRGPGALVEMLWTSSEANTIGGFGPGDSKKSAKAALDAVFRFKVDGVNVYEIPPRRSKRWTFFGASGGEIRYLALSDPIKLPHLRNVRRVLDRAGD
jgi:hypothetical protein